MPFTQVQKKAVEYLGELVTTAGASVSLAGLDLTEYEFLTFQINGVNATLGGALRQNGQSISAATTSTKRLYGKIEVNLRNSLGVSVLGVESALPMAAVGITYNSGLTKASVSIDFAISANVFTNGSILIYGHRS